MDRTENAFPGRWRIAEMEMWDADARDPMGPAHIEFGPEGTGDLRFVALQAALDCRYSERDGRPLVEFTWEGDDDGDHACGRGWAGIGEQNRIVGHVFIHLGDDSSFEARKAG